MNSAEIDRERTALIVAVTVEYARGVCCVCAQAMKSAITPSEPARDRSKAVGIGSGTADGVGTSLRSAGEHSGLAAH